MHKDHGISQCSTNRCFWEGVNAIEYLYLLPCQTLLLPLLTTPREHWLGSQDHSFDYPPAQTYIFKLSSQVGYFFYDSLGLAHELLFVVNWIISPKEIHIIIPGAREYTILHGKRGLADMIKLRTLRCRDYPHGFNGFTRLLIRGRHKGQRRKCDNGNGSQWIRERSEDAELITLKMEKRATGQGMWVTSRSWKKQGDGFFPRVSRRNKTWWYLKIGPVRLILIFWSVVLDDNKFALLNHHICVNLLQ